MLNMANKGVSHRQRAALLLFPTQRQLNSETHLLKKCKPARPVVQKARGGCTFLVHTELTLNVLTQLKC